MRPSTAAGTIRLKNLTKREEVRMSEKELIRLIIITKIHFFLSFGSMCASKTAAESTWFFIEVTPIIDLAIAR